MRAAFYERPGPADEVLVLGDLADPVPGPGEVKVALQWSGVNPSDVKGRAGSRGPTLPSARIVPHSDGMGVIEAAGAGVDPARIGQRVWLWNAAWGRPFGTAAQAITLPAAQAVPLPDGTSGEAGACLGIPALTALHAVLTDGGIEGQRVLVAGGAGAVGHYAVQFARLLGARQVIATVSSAEKAAIARAAGADLAIDYKTDNVPERVREATGGQGVDRIVEVDIAANAATNLQALRPDGLIVVYGSGQREVTLPFFPLISGNVGLRFFIVYHLSLADRHRAITTLDGLLRRGLLQHAIALRLPLDRIAEAHRAVESGRTVGNVVLQIG